MTVSSSGKSTARRDLAVTVAAALGFLALFRWLGARDAWDRWAHTYKAWGADELPFALAAASLAFAWFAYRRWREHRHSSARYRNLYNKTPVMLHSIDAQRRLVSVSDQWLENLGYRREEVLGRRVVEFMTEASRRYATEVTLPAFMKGGHCEDVELQFVRKNGEIVDVLLSATAERDADGGVLRSLAVLTDVTDLKRAQSELALSEARFRGIVEHLPSVIILKQPDGQFLFVNNLFETWYGVSPADVVTKTAHDFAPKDIADALVADDRKALETGRTVSREVEIDFADGTRHLVLTTRFPILDENGRPAAVCAINTDLTDLKESEAALQAAKEAAELANRAKSDFLANMSHELRTPLNAIIGFAEILRDQRFGPLGHPDYADFAGEIDRAGQHLLSLIADLLDLAKIEAGKADLREESLDLVRLIEACVAMVRERALAAELTLEVELEPGLPPVWADGRMVKQILLNLLSNAVKFTDPGGRVTLTAAQEPGAGLLLTVSDTGIGMAPEEIEQAMVRFGQIERHVRRGHQGSGLGLPLARSLAELHGGALEIASEPDRGTSATLVLPAWRMGVSQVVTKPSRAKKAAGV